MSDRPTKSLDCASPCEPGLVEFTFVHVCHGRQPIETVECLGRVPRGVGEYMSLARGLTAAVDLGTTDLTLSIDNENIANQLSGKCRATHPDLLPFCQAIGRLLAKFDTVKIKHIPRAHTKRSDDLRDEALDGKQGKGATNTHYVDILFVTAHPRGELIMFSQ